MKLRMAMVFAKDMQRMTAFYRDGIGLRFLADKSTPDWSEFDAGGVKFALHEIPGHIARGIHVAQPPKAREGTPIKLFFETEDIATARQTLIALGGIMDEVDGRLGFPSCSGLDPEGNVFTLVQG
jgi:predicted enzyme related to lactoylglutathione lyase